MFYLSIVLELLKKHPTKEGSRMEINNFINLDVVYILSHPKISW